MSKTNHANNTCIKDDDAPDWVNEFGKSMQDLLPGAAKSWRDEADRQREMMESFFYLRASDEVMDKFGSTFVVHPLPEIDANTFEDSINTHLRRYMKALRMEAYNKALIAFLSDGKVAGETRQDP